MSKRGLFSLLILLQILTSVSAVDAESAKIAQQFADNSWNSARAEAMGYERIGFFCEPGTTELTPQHVVLAYAITKPTTRIIMMMANESEASTLIAQAGGG